MQRASTLLGGVSARYTRVSHAVRVDVFCKATHACIFRDYFGQEKVEDHEAGVEFIVVRRCHPHANLLKDILDDAKTPTFFVRFTVEINLVPLL